MIWLFVALALLASEGTSFREQAISDSTMAVVAKIEEIDMLMGSAVYRSGVRPKQYDNFEELQKIATTPELIELTNYPNGVVRCYAFTALTHRPAINIFPIVVAHIDDNEMVTTQFGCIRSEMAVGDIFIGLATPCHTGGTAKTLSLTATQMATLDSILIYSNKNLQARKDAIRRTGTNASLYGRIRELAVQNNDQLSVVALAKYQKEQDIALIANNRDKGKEDGKGYVYTYQAVQEFPHADFLSLLESHLHRAVKETKVNSEWGELYRAIASYNNAKAAELLAVPLRTVRNQSLRSRHIDAVFGALCEYRCPLYDSLLWQLWREEQKISPVIYAYLSCKNSREAFELTKKNLLDIEGVYRANTPALGMESTTDTLIDDMLEFALLAEREFALEVMRTGIQHADVLRFLVIAKKAMAVHDSSFVEPLFLRLKSEENPHVYLKIVELLLLYNDPNVNRRIMEVKAINQNMNRDWGGKALAKLLRANNID